MAKYKYDTYHIDSFGGGSNIYLKLITCYDTIVIQDIIEKYVLHWYHTYIFYPGMYGMEVMIRQHLYWTGTREAVQK